MTTEVEHVLDEVLDYLEGRSPPDRQRAIRLHLRRCGDCAEQYETAELIYHELLADGLRHLHHGKIAALGSDTGWTASEVELRHLEACRDCREKLAWARDVAGELEGPTGVRAEVSSIVPRNRMRWLALGAAIAAGLVILFTRPAPQEEAPETDVRTVARLEPVDRTQLGPQSPDDPDATHALAIEEYEQGDYAAARDRLEKLPVSLDERTELTLLRGSSELLSGRPAGALPHLGRAAATAWSSELEIEARWQLANARLALGQSHSALADLQVLGSVSSGRTDDIRNLTATLIEHGVTPSTSSLGPIAPRLFVSSSWLIRRVKGNGAGAAPLITDGSPRQIAIDAETGLMYWADRLPARIARGPLGGGEFEVLVGDNLVSPHGLAVHSELGRMYWTDSHRGQIESALIDGIDRESILLGLDAPRYLALDPGAAKLYWTEQGGDGLIARANLDGSELEILLAGRHAFGIALDLDAGKMYWTEYDGNRIVRANLDGTELEVLVQMGGEVRPTGIAIHAGRLYWTDAVGGLLRRSDLDGQRVETVLELGEPGYDVAIDRGASPFVPARATPRPDR